MLTVIALTQVLGAGTVIARTVTAVTVDVNDITLVVGVNGGKGREQARAVTHLGVVADDVAQGSHQHLVSLAECVVVIIDGSIAKRHQRG